VTDPNSGDLPTPTLMRLGVSEQDVSRVTGILVDRGCLRRHPDNDDRDRVTVELTERGQRVVNAVRNLAGLRARRRVRVQGSPVDPDGNVIRFGSPTNEE
jgi:DNA-binding MarR family transcriptional regulator